MRKRIKKITSKNDLVKPISYQIFYIIVGSIAGLVVLGTFIIYLVKEKKLLII